MAIQEINSIRSPTDKHELHCCGTITCFSLDFVNMKDMKHESNMDREQWIYVSIVFTTPEKSDKRQEGVGRICIVPRSNLLPVAWWGN